MKVEQRSFLILLYLLVFSVTVNVAWYSYTHFIRDDAFITFRYAQNIASGKGFIYNAGESVYGTSSPGLALLLAAWLKLFPDYPVSGALGLNILASTLSLILVWRLLEGLTGGKQALNLFILIWSDKLLLHSMEGMETPLVVTCMLASLYFLSKEKPVLAGVTSGLMLWFRLDSALWIVVLACVGWMQHRRNIVTFIMITGVTYLPWLIFAWLHFGNIIPQTAIAKKVAYGLNAPPWTQRIGFLSWFSPFTILVNQNIARLVASLTIVIAFTGAWAYRKNTWLRAFGIFFVSQSAALLALNMTVEQRYFATNLYILLILLGIGIAVVWKDASERFNFLEWKWNSLLLIVYCITALMFALPRVQHIREQQQYVYDLSLQQMGLWLRQNSSPDSIVYLEPLGYVGYYSRRTMLDDVGLVTPSVTPLKQAGLDSFLLALSLNPDYIIFHCDDAKRAPQGYPYQMVIRFDPLGFEAGKEWEDQSIQRNACYELHIKIPVH